MKFKCRIGFHDWEYSPYTALGGYGGLDLMQMAVCRDCGRMRRVKVGDATLEEWRAGTGRVSKREQRGMQK